MFPKKVLIYEVQRTSLCVMIFHHGFVNVVQIISDSLHFSKAHPIIKNESPESFPHGGMDTKLERLFPKAYFRFGLRWWVLFPLFPISLLSLLRSCFSLGFLLGFVLFVHWSKVLQQSVKQHDAFVIKEAIEVGIAVG